MKFLDPKIDIAFKKIFGSDHHKNLTDIPAPLQDLSEAFNVLDQLQWSAMDLQEYSEEQENIDKARRQQVGAHEEGLEEGQQRKAEAIAIKMLKKNKTLTEISEFTDLTIEQIEILKTRL